MRNFNFLGFLLGQVIVVIAAAIHSIRDVPFALAVIAFGWAVVGLAFLGVALQPHMGRAVAAFARWYQGLVDMAKERDRR